MNTLTKLRFFGAAAFTLVACEAMSALPETELSAFLAGKAFTYDTAGHPKSKGANMTVKIPLTWKAQEGDRPNVVQKFRSENGTGLANCLIITKELPQELTPNEAKELFNEANMKDMFSASPFTYVRSTPMVIEGLPAGFVEYDVTAQRLDNTFAGRGGSFVFCYKRTMIQIQFMTAAAATSREDVLSAFKAYTPLFRAIANTVVLKDKWK